MWHAIHNWLNRTNGGRQRNNDYASERQRMVEQQLKRRGIHDPRVLEAMGSVPRHMFVAPHVQSAAYADTALPIGHGQTISQPYVVALMIQAAQIEAQDKVLEIGTGSGYSAAVMSRIAGEVYTIERHKELADAACERFRKLAYDNVHVIHADGSEGRPDAAPFDAIVVTAAAPDVPQPLVEQLVDGGRLIVPIGSRAGQTLIRIVKRGDKLHRESLTEVRFVPLVGEHGWAHQ